MKSGDFCFAHMDCKHVMKKYSISEEGDKMNECECAGHRPRNGRLLHLLYAQESLLFVLPLSPLTSQSATGGSCFSVSVWDWKPTDQLFKEKGCGKGKKKRWGRGG